MVFFWCVLVVLLYTVSSQECTSGFVGDLEGVLEGVDPSALTTIANNNNLMYIYPSLTFTCDGVITGVRMVMPSREDRPFTISTQQVFMIIAVFSNSTLSDVIVLKNENVNRIPGTPTIWRTSDTNILNTAVRSGDYIGVAIPRDNITGESIYYQRIAVDSSGPIIQGSTFGLNYNDETEFEQMVRSATVSNGPGLQNRPLIQFTLVPASVVPSPTATPTATPTDTSTGPPPNVGTIIAGAVVGGVVVMTIIFLLMIPVTIVLVKKCKKSSSSDNDHTHNYACPQIELPYEVPLEKNPAYATTDDCSTMQSTSDYTYI